MRSTKVDGAAIRRAREMAGHMQEDLAKRLGIDRSAVAHWEANRKQPTGANFKRLCKLLQVAPESLLVQQEEAA